MELSKLKNSVIIFLYIIWSINTPNWFKSKKIKIRIKVNQALLLGYCHDKTLDSRDFKSGLLGVKRGQTWKSTKVFVLV